MMAVAPSPSTPSEADSREAAARTALQRRRASRGGPSVLLAAALCWASVAPAQQENYDRDRRFATQPIAETAEAPDTTGFWFYVQRGEITRARAEMERLRQLAPGWTPGQEMRRALERPQDATEQTRVPDAVTTAQRAQDARMQRLTAIAPTEYGSLSAKLLDRAAAEARRLERADDLLLLAWIAIERGALNRAMALLADAEATDPTIASDDARQRVLRERVRVAVERRDADALAELLATGVTAVDELRAAAWSSFESRAVDDALWRFRQLPPTADRALGEALSLRALGRDSDAIDTACGDALRENDPTYCRDWLAETLAARYANGRFTDAVALGQRLDTLGLSSPGSMELMAWALLELGEPEAAASRLEAVLTDAPERSDIAAALLTATDGDAERQAKLAARHAAVRRVQHERRIDQAFARKQFDRVAQLGRDGSAVDSAGRARAGNTGRDGLEVTGRVDWRRREGGTGLSTVDLREASVNATARWADWRWTLRVDDSDFQMPAVEAGSWFGSAPVGGDFPGLRAVRDEGWRIEIGREFDGLNLYAGIARDLVDQPANETITGQISASVFGESSTTALTAYHRYRDDTFLSRVGNVDAREPAPFGGAVSTGLRGLYARSVAADWSAAVSGHYETIRGEHLADNRSWQLRADLAVDHGGDRSDYWRTGPYLSGWHFRKNLSDYSFGHGGYFSPDVFASIGLASEILSLEGARWQFKGAVNVALSRIEQDAYFRFPRGGGGPRLPGTRDTGVSGEITLQAQYRLSKRWRLSGYLYHLNAIEFEATAAGVALHWSPGVRLGAYSRDLPLEAPWLKGFAL